jgi:predicted metal-dependent peptidase
MNIKNIINMIILTEPFFATVLFHVEHQEDAEIETACTNGSKIKYNPTFMGSLSATDQQFIVLHELYHIILKHHLRRGSRDAKLWNIACDCVINQMLKEKFGKVPANGIDTPQYKGWTAEAVYEEIRKDGSQKPSGSGVGDIQDAEQGDDNGSGESNLNTESKVDRILQKAATIARMAGKLTSGMEELIGMGTANTDWQSALSTFISSQFKDDYSYLKPNRRNMLSGVVMPSLYTEKKLPIAIAIDTSGSVSRREIEMFLAETQSISDTFSVPITLMDCDSKVSIRNFEAGEEIPRTITGRGGTSFAPPVKYINTCEEEYAGIVYFTDSDCSDFERTAPSIPMLWVVSRKVSFKPPYGEVVYVVV